MNDLNNNNNNEIKNEENNSVEQIQYLKIKYSILRTIIIILTVVLILIMMYGVYLINLLFFTPPIQEAAKPIIYIYPDEEEIALTVSLGYPEKVTCIYPEQNGDNMWNIIAKKDGTIVDESTGKEYYSLYWEGLNTKTYGDNLEEGFVIENKDIANFLEEKLEILGLNYKEREEFIIYWLPQLQENKYVYIRFQSMDEIEENMPLYISEKPDTLIRVMMEWKGLEKYKEVKEQKLEKVQREGFTVVEWGGTEIK